MNLERLARRDPAMGYQKKGHETKFEPAGVKIKQGRELFFSHLILLIALSLWIALKITALVLGFIVGFIF